MSSKRALSVQKPVIDTTVVGMDGADYLDLIEALFRDEDSVGLILLLDELAYDAITSWQQTEEASVDEITAVRDTHLLPVIHRLGWACLNAVRFHQLTVCREGLDRLARIYDLGRLRELGTVQGESHLSWTVPSRYSLTQLYVVGGYALFRQQMEIVRTLLRLQARDSYRRARVPVLSHPHFEYGPGEGDSRTYFDDARQQMTNAPALDLLFFHDEDEVIDSLCQFDFIAAYSLWRQQKNSHMNFGRFGNSRTTPIIEQLLEPAASKTLLGSFEPQRFADFLRQVNTQCTHIYGMQGWQPGGWTDAIRGFLREYPPDQEEA